MVPIIRNVLTYVVLFPTSRDLSPIEVASVVIPMCLGVSCMSWFLFYISDQILMLLSYLWFSFWCHQILLLIAYSVSFEFDEQMSGFTICLQLIIA
jgi:hypothetical protein